MPKFICTACGTQFAEQDTESSHCPICEDPRQYVPEAGQRWTTLDALREDHAATIRADGGYTGIGVEPWFAIGERVLLVPWGERALLPRVT